MTAALSDDRAIVESAVRRAWQLAMKRAMTEDDAVALIAAAFEEKRATVTTKEAEAAEGARLLARHDELVARGKGCHAAMITAREFAEPHEWATVAKRIGRLRAARDRASRKKRAA